MYPSAVLSVLVTANTAPANAALAKTQAQMKSMGTTANAMGAKVMTGLKYTSLAAVGVGAVSVKMATDFNQSMTLVQTQAGASASEVSHLRGQVLELAKTSEFGPDQLAKALYRVESAGYRGERAMQVLNKAQQLAEVGQSDLESTTFAMTAAMRSGIRGTHNLSNTVGTLNAAVGLGNMRMDDLVGAMSTGILPAGRAAGLSLRDVTAALDTMTRTGVPAEQAAMRLRMTFNLMAAPTDKAKNALESIGLTEESLAKKMRGPQGLIGALELLVAHLGTLPGGAQGIKAQQIISEAFGGARSGTTIKALIQNMDQLRTVYGQTGTQASRFGELLQKQIETPAHKFHVAVSQMEVALVNLGAQLLPTAVAIVSALTKIAAVFTSLPDPIKNTVFAIALLAYPILKIIGLCSALKLAMMSALTAPWMPMAVTRFVAGIGSMATALAGPAGLAIAVVGVGFALNALFPGLFGGISAQKRFGDATTKLNDLLPDLADYVNRTADAHERLKKATVNLNELNNKGLGDTKEAARAAEERAQAVYDTLVNERKLQELMSGKTAELATERDAIAQAQGDLQRLRAQQAANPWQDLSQQIAAAQSKIHPMVVQYRLDMVNARRASLGFATKIPEQFGHVVDTFRSTFGKKWMIRIGTWTDPKLATMFQMYSNQLNYITGGKAKKWIIRIMTDPKMDPGEKIDAVTRKLSKLSKRYGFRLDTKGLVQDINQARQQITGLNQIVKENAPNPKPYETWADRVKRAARSVKPVVHNVISDIHGLIGREIGNLGGIVTWGGGGKGLQRGGFAQVGGSSTGDNHIVSARVESGELLGVINRNAARHIDAINKKWPRFQKGGWQSSFPPTLPLSRSSPPGGGFDEVASRQGNRFSTAANPMYMRYFKPMTMAQFGISHAVGPYKYGGGHGGNFAGPYDCSGFVSAILHAGGLLGSPMTTDGLKGYGEAGPGKIVTIGVRGSSGRNAHTMIQVGGRYFESGGSAGGASVVGGWDGAFPIKRHPPGLQRGGIVDPLDPRSPLFIGWGLQKGGAVGRGAAIHQITNKGSTFVSTAYGPPWNAMNGTGVTSTGVDLRGGAHKYIVARDPAVIPDHMKLAIWPNPFGTLESFAAEDTGGAIKGKRIDFYDWRGRGTQMGWGRKAVKVLRGGLSGKAAGGAAGGAAATTGAEATKIPKKLKRKIARLGMPAALQKEIDAAAGLVEEYADYADRANQLDDLVKGYDQLHWLRAQLDQLFILRNKLVKAHLGLVSKLARLNKMLKQARGKTAKDAIKGQITADTEKDADIVSTLRELQGPGSPMSILTEWPAIDVLGGQIFDVRKSIRDLGADDKKGLSASALKEVGYLSTLGVKFDPTKFAGFFAQGGMLGAGKWGIAGEKGAEAVVGPAAIVPAGGGAQVNVHVYVGDREITDIVRVEIDNDKRQGKNNYRQGNRPN